jgi:hypothetical protein
MTSNVIQTIDQNVWQQRSARGETLWCWITWAFAAYWTLFIAGAFLGRKELNAVGGVLVLAVLAWVLVERLWVRLDAVVVASLSAATFIPIVQAMLGNPGTAEALFKHLSLCMVIACSRLLQLPEANKSKMRWIMLAQVLMVLLISMTIFRGSSWDGGTRHSGLFVNPNNLALIPFLLLFFVNPFKDKWFVHFAVHAIVVAGLAYTGTSGAVLAYIIGLSVYLAGMVTQKSRSVFYGTAVIGVLMLIAFVSLGGERILPETRMTNQISVVRGQLANVLAGGDVAYYEQEKVLGPGTGSAIWRVAHWRRTITIYSEGTFAQQILGFGIGRSPEILSKLPHNEYLRMLFEQGFVGLAVFIFVWYRIIKTAPREVRYIGLIVAIYSFSENNLDNFPFMALFTLCLSARGLGSLIETKIARPLPAMWDTSMQQA